MPPLGLEAGGRSLEFMHYCARAITGAAVKSVCDIQQLGSSLL
jgi:hypothetical protein